MGDGVTFTRNSLVWKPFSNPLASLNTPTAPPLVLCIKRFKEKSEHESS